MDNYISTFRIPIDKIPEAKRWKVGGRYKIVADIEQTGVNKERDYSGDINEPISSTALRRKTEKPKYRTMVEFKVCDVSAKHEALNKKIHG